MEYNEMIIIQSRGKYRLVDPQKIEEWDRISHLAIQGKGEISALEKYVREYNERSKSSFRGLRRYSKQTKFFG